MANPYIVISRPGFYGRTGRVFSTHASLDAARRAAKRHNYVDERGNRRSTAIVALNDYDQYQKGSEFYGDMPPTPVSE